MFKPWQLAAIDEVGYNGISDKHIDSVADSLRMSGISEIDRATFEKHCRMCGIDPDNFTQEDLDHLEDVLNS